MIDFANLKYAVYVVLSACIVALFYGGYLFWKSFALKRLIPNASVRMRIVAQHRALSYIKHAIIFLAIALFAIAVLRPRWGDEMRESSIEGVDVLVALDVSTSMLARDISPSRLDRAKDAIRILAGALEGDRIGLVLFAGEAFMQCPLTADIEAFHMFLNAASPASVRIPGTDIGAALDLAYRVFNRRRMTSRNFVLITDGEDHAGKVNAAIEKFKELDVTVHVLGIGREGGDVIPLAADDPTGGVYQKDTKGNIVRTKRNDDLLRRLAEATGGTYYDINASFAGVYRIIDRIAAQQRSRDGTQLVKQKKERYSIFALVLAIVLMVELLLPGKNIRDGESTAPSASSIGKMLREWFRAVFRRNYGKK